MRFLLAATAAFAILSLSGCAYDYLQRSDKIAYSAGDAVKANLARETTNPAGPTSTKGLGKNGSVVPPPPDP
ncbi:MAG: hypothetical protein EOP22_16295 [Hyphomicrobiales bacterium]|nr:MAG: hypothetical protein EOP22_16295 [Hyphomicrobiales bacterium]